ncbi:MAG: Manganese/iron superoxide dismutase [Parcubacteria group bacterium GW2011_GWC2_52_8c]|nr:MAG: Manganese/iron superoxide dismutase [Parcubacteria group bacterium GW2011_GWA1_51_12]KKW31509.1 MAG: Manganese/iron superoxide dismutase [Parcubacteria group bacterium GW2011_GWC2_52_8c]
MAADGGGEPTGAIRQWIEEDFGSVAKFLDDFRATGMAARGWVILAFDLDEGKLRTYLCDSHNQGGVWNSVALLIMDVYEHAYFIDYATGRKAYIEAFMKLIDWDEVNSIAEKFNLGQYRK